MVKRYLNVILFVSAALFLLGGTAHTAAAQNAIAGTARGFSDLAGFVKRPFKPVKIWRLDGPTVLETGEVGIFAASANTESASLPFWGRWDFGDGTSAKSLSARHRYAAPGIYTVIFSLSNEESEATDSLTVTVVAPQTMQTPPGDAATVEVSTSAPLPLHPGQEPRRDSSHGLKDEH